MLILPIMQLMRAYDRRLQVYMYCQNIFGEPMTLTLMTASTPAHVTNTYTIASFQFDEVMLKYNR